MIDLKIGTLYDIRTICSSAPVHFVLLEIKHRDGKPSILAVFDIIASKKFHFVWFDGYIMQEIKGT